MAGELNSKVSNFEGLDPFAASCFTPSRRDSFSGKNLVCHGAAPCTGLEAASLQQHLEFAQIFLGL